MRNKDLTNQLNTLKSDKLTLEIRNQELATHIEELEELEVSTETMFRIAAEQYDIDFKLIYAIATLETGHFTSRL